MTENLVNFFSQFPPQLSVFLMAMTPIGELRLSLPVGVLALHLPVWQVFILSVVGNMIPATLLLLFAPAFHRYVEKKSGFFGSSWAKFLARAQKKIAGDYARWGLIGLAIFVGIPLPMTGAWTGAAAAFVLGLPFFKSWLAILTGVIMAAVIILLATLGVVKIF